MIGGGIPLIKWNTNLIRAQEKELSDKEISNLIAYPIGGVYCGLYRRSLLIDNKIRFPEHLRFEDNYWGCLLKPYIRSYSLVPEVLYYYRSNPGSTVNGRNAMYMKDERLQIEEMIISETTSRGLYSRFQEAYEYGYIFRRTFNTYGMVVKSFDKIDKGFLKCLVKTMVEKIPDWEKNQYYKELTGLKRKIKDRLTVKCPILLASVICMLKTK